MIQVRDVFCDHAHGYEIELMLGRAVFHQALVVIMHERVLADVVVRVYAEYIFAP